MLASRIDVGLKLAFLAAVVLAPAGLFYHIYGAFIGVVVATLLGSAVFALVWTGYRALRRRRNVARNPLDPALRAYVASDISWENCAQAPAFAQQVLEHFRFLIEDEQFAPAVMSGEGKHMTFRRDDLVIDIGEAHASLGSGPVIAVTQMRSPNSFRPIASTGAIDDIGEFGDGFRGAAFFLRMNLERMIEDLRSHGGNLHNPSPTAARHLERQ